MHLDSQPRRVATTLFLLAALALAWHGGLDRSALSQTDVTFTRALAEDCEPTPTQLDPYTCRVSVILPFAPERFQNMPLRLHIEETLRLEAPAHVSLKICWINNEQMRGFEAAYRAWLHESARERPVPDERDARLADLLAIMNDLRNVFPEAILHDCRDEDATSIAEAIREAVRVWRGERERDDDETMVLVPPERQNSRSLKDLVAELEHKEETTIEDEWVLLDENREKLVHVPPPSAARPRRAASSS